MTHESRDDELILGLGRLPDAAFERSASDASLRAGILRQTRGVIRARKRAWRALLAIAGILLYAAGAGTVAVMNRGVEPDRSPSEPAAVQPALEVPAPAASSMPSDLEARARSAPQPDRIALLEAAGDGYLGVADLEGALRCYRAALALAPAEERGRVDADDSWLLSALKTSS